MTIRTTATLAIIAAVALGACSRKPPPELPPQPAGTYDPNPTAPGTLPGAAAPGSQADFVATVMSDRVFFDTDRFDIDADDQQILASQAQWLARYPDVQIVVEGHADERGTRDYNLALGERRANSAKNALAAYGIPASRIRTISYGKERPEALGSGEDAYARNRRAVTVTVR